MKIPEVIVPPPSQHNVVFLQASDPRASPASPRRPSAPLGDATRPPPPASPTTGPRSTSTPRSRPNPRHWAFSTTDFNGVVSTYVLSLTLYAC